MRSVSHFAVVVPLAGMGMLGHIKLLASRYPVQSTRCLRLLAIVANRPGTSGTVLDLKALSRIPKFTWIVLDFPGSSDKSGLSSFIEGHLALASVEQ